MKSFTCLCVFVLFLACLYAEPILLEDDNILAKESNNLIPNIIPKHDHWGHHGHGHGHGHGCHGHKHVCFITTINCYFNGSSFNLDGRTSSSSSPSSC